MTKEYTWYKLSRLFLRATVAVSFATEWVYELSGSILGDPSFHAEKGACLFPPTSAVVVGVKAHTGVSAHVGVVAQDRGKKRARPNHYNRQHF